MGKCRVLIVEDEFIMRQGIKHMINWEGEGFTIVGEAVNGKEALDIIEEVSPNIIISDIVMPILDGVDFSKLVQKKYPEIQIIILSSYDKFEYVKSTLLSGAVDYILKPTLTPSNLIITLNKAVNRIPGMELIKNDKEDYHSFIEKFIPFIGQRFYYKNTSLLCTENAIKEKSRKFDFDKFYNEIKIKEFDLAFNNTEDYINHAIFTKMNEQKLKSLIKNLLYTMLVSIEEYCNNTDELRDKYFNMVEQALYSTELLEAINSIFRELKMIISENCDEEDSMKNILEYINNNYATYLDLGAISQKFSFNYSYLSSYFSNHCKEGFSEYLNKIRVEKACELLKGNKHYVSEISSMVGYSDHSYFCRVFKKIKGYTPSNYRRLNLLMEDKNDK